MRTFDLRTCTIMLAAGLLGVLTAWMALTAAGTLRNDATVRPLVWAIVATPLLLGVGWALARRSERALAAGCCFCLYIFTPFVAARLETLIAPAPLGQAGGSHSFYFAAVIGLHCLAAIGLTLWRTWTPATRPGAAALAD